MKSWPLVLQKNAVAPIALIAGDDRCPNHFGLAIMRKLRVELVGPRDACRMPEDTYYRDHWIDISAERLDTYEAMFAWHPRMQPLLHPAAITAGQTVLDYGCGPGGLAVEIGRQVGPDGNVVGLDLNAQMIARAAELAAQQGLHERVSFVHSEASILPFADNTFDRVLCKSVLEYVAEPELVLAEFKRVTRPGGKVHVIDSDWHMLVAEPLPDAAMRSLFSAASKAYKTPRIGRKLYGLFKQAGFENVCVKILSAADTAGARAPIIRHMIGYARAAGALPDAELDALLVQIDAVIADGTFMLVLPQFLVTGDVV